MVFPSSSFLKSSGIFNVGKSNYLHGLISEKMYLSSSNFLQKQHTYRLSLYAESQFVRDFIIFLQLNRTVEKHL